MQTVSSSPHRGASSPSKRAKSSHRAAVTTYRVVGSTGRGAPGKSTVASQNDPQGRYQTRELLGRGGMSEVYRGFDAELRRPVAIKRLRPDLAMNPVFRARFRREAQAAGRLSHPAIVAVYDTGEEREAAGPSIPFIVMELIEGRSLRDALHKEGKVSPVRALELTAEVLDALSCSHAAGIIHRDIKPGNVMLTNARTVKVADFGIARAVSDSSGTATMAGTVIGTAQYLSPEQGRGEAADVRSDLYSVGCMLYELLVGEPPFSGDSMVSIIFQHISEPPTPPSDKCENVSSDVDAIVLKAVAKDPDDRYQSAAEMKADIERVLNGHSPVATTVLPASMIQPTQGHTRQGGSADRHTVQTPAGKPRARRLVGSMSALLLVLACGSAFGVYKSDQPEAAAVTTTEVPAVLGLGRVGVESLLRNADLVPQFKFVHSADGASVNTAIRQSPASGDLAAINGTVTVVINIGPRLDASQPHLVARDVDYRPTARPGVTSKGQSRPNNGSGSSYRWGAQQSESGNETGGSDEGEGGQKKTEKSGKGKKEH